jgi:diketogulonate reductase-like aldo/keto reductase
VDTAARYRNEESVGKAILKSGIPRKEMFVTTKIWHEDHGYERTITAGMASLKRLGTGYIDLLLIHAPGKKTVSTWQAMIQLKEEGICRSIGVSNFGVHHLEELHRATGVTPSVNQIEISPYLQHRDIVQYCREHGIAIEGYSPLTKGIKLDDPVLQKIADKYSALILMSDHKLDLFFRYLGKTPAHVLIRWSVQQGFITIPKSVKEERIKSNIDVFNFELSQEDMADLEKLEEHLITGRWDPVASEWNP